MRKDGDKTLFAKLSELALERAVETAVEEGIETVFEIWKKHRLKVQERAFESSADDGTGADSQSTSASVTDFDVSTPGGRRGYPGREEDGPADEGSSRIESLDAFASRESDE